MGATYLTATTLCTQDGQAYSSASDAVRPSKHVFRLTSSHSFFSWSTTLSRAGKATLTTSILSTLYLTRLQFPHCNLCSIPYAKYSVGCFPRQGNDTISTKQLVTVKNTYPISLSFCYPSSELPSSVPKTPLNPVVSS